MRNARVRNQRDVGEGERVADKEIRARKLSFHPRQGGVSTRQQCRIELGFGLARIEKARNANRDIGLVAVLLPKQLFEHLAARIAVGRDQRRALRKMHDDGVGLR